MQLLKRFFKYLFFLLSPMLLYLLAAFVLAKIPTNPASTFPSIDSEDSIEVFVRSNGIHTDFILPLQSPSKNWSEIVSFNDFKAVDSSRVKYLSFGWGDKGFYLETPTWDDLKVSTVLKAAFIPSPTVMHIDTWYNPPRLSENCKSLFLKTAQYQALSHYIEASFQKNQQGQLQLIRDKNYSDYDNFYVGGGSYHAFNTCNNWTNQGLKTAQVRTALWSPFVGGIMEHLSE